MGSPYNVRVMLSAGNDKENLSLSHLLSLSANALPGGQILIPHIFASRTHSVYLKISLPKDFTKIGLRKQINQISYIPFIKMSGMERAG